MNYAIEFDIKSMTKKKITIEMPILGADFVQASKLIDENIARDVNFGLEYLQDLAVGEIFVAKDDDKVVGVLAMRRPGAIFAELDLKHFSLDKIKSPKKDIGYITIVAVDPNYQGQGIGRMLLETGLKQQKEFGAKCVGAQCWQGSPGNASLKMFKKFGFIELKLHKKLREKYSKDLGKNGYWCPVCGNPCVCDDIEVIKYL